MTQFKSTHATHRFSGIRWQIRFGSYQGIEAFAINEIQRCFQAFVPYTIDVSESVIGESLEEASQGDHLLILGTPDNSPLVELFLKESGLKLPENEEGYLVVSQPSFWNSKQKIVVIIGLTPKGVLNGVVDFNTRILGANVLKNDPIQIKLPEDFPSFNFSESPKIKNRGIWTWGYAIYDYRGFFDNMARLRMNMITIWNDCPPVNISEVIDYAHSRGVKVVLGFPWGWGMDLDLSDHEDQLKLKQFVIESYEKEYQHLAHDGIYFQTLTETNQRMVNGKPRAKVVCELVNLISRELLDRHPCLDIQFGLHASSILEDYPLLASLDKRVAITWEDAGTIPFAYDLLDINDSPENTTGDNSLNSAQGTIDYSRKIASLREGCSFAMVVKGFSGIRWNNEFEHHKSFILGERSESFMQQRLEVQQASWERQNGLWFAHYQEAINFYQVLLEENSDNMNVTILIEDGLFEKRIQPCVALFGNILWNPNEKAKNLMINSHSAYLTGNL